MLLDKASVADSMVDIFSHCNGGIAPPFVVSTPHEVEHCSVYPMVLGCNEAYWEPQMEHLLGQSPLKVLGAPPVQWQPI